MIVRVKNAAAKSEVCPQRFGIADLPVALGDRKTE